MMNIEQYQICSYLSKAIAQPGSITQASYKYDTDLAL